MCNHMDQQSSCNRVYRGGMKRCSPSTRMYSLTRLLTASFPLAFPAPSSQLPSTPPPPNQPHSRPNPPLLIRTTYFSSLNLLATGEAEMWAAVVNEAREESVDEWRAWCEGECSRKKDRASRGNEVDSKVRYVWTNTGKRSGRSSFCQPVQNMSRRCQQDLLHRA